VGKKYIVELTQEERTRLLELTRKGECKARRLKRALVLLSADEGKVDREIATEVRVHEVTIERLRRRFVEGGLEAALSERPRPGAARKLDGHQRAMLVALACSDPPDGRAKWTMQLLADRLVELTELESISDETVRVALKKGGASPGSASAGASPR
jgi:transposase